MVPRASLHLLPLLPLLQRLLAPPRSRWTPAIANHASTANPHCTALSPVALLPLLLRKVRRFLAASPLPHYTVRR